MEGIIESISIKPVSIDNESLAQCVIEFKFNANKLSKLYESNNINPALIDTFDVDMYGDDQTYNLSEAADDNMTLTQRIEWLIARPGD